MVRFSHRWVRASPRSLTRTARHSHVRTFRFLIVPSFLLLLLAGFIRPATNSQAAPLPTRAAHGNTGNAGDWDGQFFSGSGGAARGPFSLKGGRYHVFVSAFYNGLHTTSSSCSFTAHLEGVEHALPPAFANLGTAIPLTDSGYTYRLPLTIVAAPGHYSLIVSPLTNCDWSVSILGGIPPEQPLAIGPVGISGESKAGVHLHESVEFSALYDVQSITTPGPSGSVSLMQRGKAVRIYPLTPGPSALGLPELHRVMSFGNADRALLGPLTAQFTLTLGATRVTRSYDFTLVDGKDLGTLAITDVSVFTKVGNSYPAGKIVHLTGQTGFTVTYESKSSGAVKPTGSLSIIHNGRVAYTFPLTAITMDDGRTGFYTIIHWDAADRVLLGALTARATVTLGRTRVSRSTNFTLIR
jgi:hypothetical protein